MRERTKRITAALLTACMGMSLATGCGSEKDAEEGKKEKESAEINLMASQNWIKDVDNELFDEFEKETGIKVKVSLTPDNEYKTLLGTTLSGGSDAVDMFMYYGGSDMKSAGIPDVAVDLSDEKWVDNMEQWAIDANTDDGKLYGFSTWG